MAPTIPSLLLLLLLSIISLSASTCLEANDSAIGVCFGELGNNLPTIARSIELIKSLNTNRFKIYGTKSTILKSIENIDLRISIMLPNELISDIHDNQTLADEWVQKNVSPFHSKSKIRHILVGNEFLSNQSTNATWHHLVPAMIKIHKATKKLGLDDIKIGTPLAMDCLELSYPPSSGTFQTSIREKVIKPLLDFLNETNSFFFVHLYTYFAWTAQPDDIKLGYALLKPNSNVTITDPYTGLVYTNLLDQMLDALVYAMRGVGYPKVRLYVAETGWPNAGGAGADAGNATIYNRNVVRLFATEEGRGTPARPGVAVPVTIFALFDENNKTGLDTERHFGLMYANGSSVYKIDLSGKTIY